VDDIPWTVTPESVASVPPPIMPPSPPPTSREPRRTPTHSFRLLDEAPAKPAKKPLRRRRRPGPWLKRLALLLVLAGVGGGGYWYFVLRHPHVPPPWAGLVERVKKLVAREPAPRPPRGGTTRRAPPPAPMPPPPPPPPPPARTPAAAPAPVRVVPPPAAATPQPPPSPFARFDRLSDSLSRAVRNYHDRAQLFASSRIDCSGLANGLVSVESLWNAYNVERRARMANFDERRALQDQAMYASVDSVESRFEQSGCPRPSR